jgi:two-component system response regulator YesN
VYKVMLVDDDYPVIELLSKWIPWDALGLRLVGAYEDGLQAWEHAEQDMPDIVITDIGMPRMNGLELISRLRAQKPNIRLAILSCHNEFQYAQQAMKLNIQEYLLKDTLEPLDLEKLLVQFKNSLDVEKQMNLHQLQLNQLVAGTKELRKERWLKDFIDEPMLSLPDWLKEAKLYGILVEETVCIPIIASIESYQQAKQRFLSDQTLRFAVNNVLEEVLKSLDLHSVHSGYSVKEFFILFTYQPNLKTNIYDQITIYLKIVQKAVQQALKLSMTYIIGESASSPQALKQGLHVLLRSGAQRFYLSEGSITKLQKTIHVQKDLFNLYDQASKELREVLTRKQAKAVVAVVEYWVAVIKENEYPPETVKDWVLKLLLDLRLKLQSLQFIHPGFSADILHKTIIDIDSLIQMKHWLIEQLESLLVVSDGGVGIGVRSEMVAACQYVSLNLDKRITLEEVAELLHLNASYFSRLFKKETGETFIEYVTRMKVERAKELLDQTSFSVGKICEMLGYDNQSYFIKIFKAHTGMTPIVYKG